MFQIGKRALIVPVISGLLALMAPAARASDISFVNAFWNIGYQQTGDGNTLTGSGDFFSADLVTNVASPYVSASLSYPGAGSPQVLTQNSPTDYGFQTGNIATLAELATAYPFGTYTFTGTYPSSATDTAGFDYTTTDYSSTPYLTGTDYTQLQGMDSSQNFTFHLSTDTPGGAPSEADAFIFFTIYDVTTGFTTAFSDGFLPATMTSILLPGGTLTPGDQYEYYIDYSDRDIMPGSGSTDFNPQLGFDTRTLGLFTTASASAVPEPRTYAALLGAAFAGLLILRRRRSSAE